MNPVLFFIDFFFSLIITITRGNYQYDGWQKKQFLKDYILTNLTCMQTPFHLIVHLLFCLFLLYVPSREGEPGVG